MAQIGTAEDPAGQAELANRLINEQNAIQASMQSLEALKVTQKQEMDAVRAAAVSEYMCQEFKKSGC